MLHWKAKLACVAAVAALAANTAAALIGYRW
jgi:hypothetical protein